MARRMLLLILKCLLDRENIERERNMERMEQKRNPILSGRPEGVTF